LILRYFLFGNESRGISGLLIASVGQALFLKDVPKGMLQPKTLVTDGTVPSGPIRDENFQAITYFLE